MHLSISTPVQNYTQHITWTINTTHHMDNLDVCNISKENDGQIERLVHSVLTNIAHVTWCVGREWYSVYWRGVEEVSGYFILFLIYSLAWLCCRVQCHCFVLCGLCCVVWAGLHLAGLWCGDLLVLMRNWLETPGWSTSWTAAANRAARISSSEKTSWESERERKKDNNTCMSVCIVA